MLASLLMTAMIAGSPPAARCALKTPASCAPHQDWRYAFGAPFRRALAAFGGETRCTAYTGRSRPLATVLLDAINGAPHDPVRLADGTFLFTASRWHDGLDRGHVVVSAQGAIVAVAFNHPVGSRNVLEIYVRRRFSGRPAWFSALYDAELETEKIIAKYDPEATASVRIWRVSDNRKAATRLDTFPLVDVNIAPPERVP
jgi:hypothetical protein